MKSVKRRVPGAGEDGMGLVLLGVGGLMALAGAYLMVSGFQIVQVEQGWASVISGSVLFAGGIVTIALGLVLRTLRRLGGLAAPMPAASEAEPAIPEISEPVLAPVPIPVPLPLAMPHAEPAEQETTHERAAPVADEVEPHPQDHAVEEPAPVEIEPEHEAAPQADARLSDDYKLETPSIPDHDLEPLGRPAAAREETPPTSLADDDWLDRAFAEIDGGLPKATPMPVVSPTPRDIPRRPEPATPAQQLEPVHLDEPPAYEEHEPVEAHTAEPEPEPVASEPPPAPADEPPAPPHKSEPEPAVIGRYESDGTFYTMFADGSIEAQSDAGVYRFASMAELKAFIEP